MPLDPHVKRLLDMVAAAGVPDISRLTPDDMRQTIRGLGLRRLNQVVERENSPETRGMIHKVRHLVEVVD